MEPKKKVGIWIRVSTEDQAKGESPENHEARAIMYAELQKWEIVAVYHLEAVSGKSVMDHPETQRMLRDIRSKAISGLIFSKLARLARNTKELLEFSDIFKAVNADLISMHELIDTSTPAGRLFFTIIAAMAQWEREEIADRVAASVPIRAKLGKPLGGQAPFGYKRVDGKLELDENEAPIRKLIFELFNQHKRKKHTAKVLNERGYKTRNGSKFTDTTIVRLIRDPLAKGLHRANYSRSLGKGKKWEEKDKKDWVFTPAPAIVSEELWEECNRILDEQNATNRKPARKAANLFSGLAICECGTKMYVPSNSPKYTCVECRNKIPCEDLEEIFHEQLKSFLNSDDEISNYLKSHHTTLGQKEKEAEILQNRIDSLFKEQKRILALHGDGTITKANFAEHWEPITNEYNQKKKYFAVLQAEIDHMKLTEASTDQVIHDARDLYSQWTGMNREDKRLLVETVTDKITIAKEDIHIELRYLPTPTSLKLMTTKQHNYRDSCWLPA
ncbi:MAG: recombinase family protein [Bacteroidetes bacterium]|nr:recombinase family protein [Bacteroidota bacterium]